MSRLPAGRIAAAIAAVVAVFLILSTTRTPRFRTVAHGVEFAEINGAPYCRHGSARIGALRVDPRVARFQVLHHTSESEEDPIPIAQWMERTRAIAVFNAGQYYPDFTYMGLLVSDGQVVSKRPHATFRAAFVADPVGGGPDARVLDLDSLSIDPARPEWRQVAQSFMLFDDQGRIRVRTTNQVARRTAVAEDSRHHVVIVSTEGSYTLHDFAILLKSAPLGLTHAMSMDGGEEAQLCVRGRKFAYANFSSWKPGAKAPDLSPAAPLPAVIAVLSE